MAQEFISEYGLDPDEFIKRLADRFQNRFSKIERRSIEEAIFVDGGPVDYLVWISLEGYENHTFFYHDEEPNVEFVQRLLLTSPAKEEMPLFKSFLQQNYETYTDLNNTVLLEIRDTYLPQMGERPRANIGICHNPLDDRIVSGVSGIPRRQEQEIFDDMDKIVPDRTFEKFITSTVQTLQTEIEEEADRHTISGEIRDILQQDRGFTLETTKELPKGIHPQYTGEEADLWQKPVSRVDYMDGAQGFLQIWIPIDEEEIALVSATAGEYDREAIVDAIREEFEVVLGTC
ncbi:hypothetical protein ACFQO4_19100 [Saliphagus sp. GCM10025334]